MIRAAVTTKFRLYVACRGGRISAYHGAGRIRAGLPVGMSFFGTAWSEPALLRLAHGFEQAAKARRAPNFAASIAFSS